MPAKEPLISVVVPLYNAGSWLDACLKSLAGQSYPHLEMVLIDDGSTDGSAEICDEWERRDGRFRAVHLPHGGVSRARNAGLKLINGDYFGFADADDLVHPDMFRHLFDVLKESGADISACQCISRDYTATDIKDIQVHNADPVIRLLNREEAVYDFLTGEEMVHSVVWNKLFPRRFQEVLHFPEGVVYEDNEVILNTLIETKTIAVTSEILYYRREHSASITHTYDSTNIHDFVRSADRVAEIIDKTFPERKEMVAAAARRSLWTKVNNWKLLQRSSDEGSLALASELQASMKPSLATLLYEMYHYPKYTCNVIFVMIAPGLSRRVYRKRLIKRGEEVS